MLGTGHVKSPTPHTPPLLTLHISAKMLLLREDKGVLLPLHVATSQRLVRLGISLHLTIVSAGSNFSTIGIAQALASVEWGPRLSKIRPNSNQAQGKTYITN